MSSVFILIKELGFPIAVALGGGFFIFFIVKYILSGVTAQVKGIHGIIMGLENRVKTMNNEIVRIDVKMCQAFGIAPDMDRIARADGQKDSRKD